MKKVFGPYIKDTKVYIHKPPRRPFLTTFFTHTAYWSLRRPGGRDAPQIVALREAINLKDT